MRKLLRQKLAAQRGLLLLVIIVSVVFTTAGCQVTYRFNDGNHAEAESTGTSAETESESRNDTKVKQEFVVKLNYPLGIWDSIKLPNDSFKDQEDFENKFFMTVDYIKSELDQSDWQLKYGVNPEVCTVNIKMMDTISMGNGGYTQLPLTDGAKGIVTTICLDKKMIEYGIDNFPHEISHLINGISFSQSITEGICEYVNRKITGKTATSYDVPVDDFIRYNLDSVKYLESEEKKNEMRDDIYEVVQSIGLDGYSYPFGNKSQQSSMWYGYSESFVEYLIDTYGVEQFMNFYKSAMSQESYNIFDERGFEAIKADWNVYLEQYTPTMSVNEIENRLKEMKNKYDIVFSNQD